jgi:hypothetical protein
MDIPSGEWFFSLADAIVASYQKINTHTNSIHIYHNKKILNIDSEWTIDTDTKIVAVYVDFLHRFIEKFDSFKNVKVVLSHNGDYIPDENIVVKWLNDNSDVKFYAQNLTFEHPRAFILPIGQANSMWPHGDKKAWQDLIVKDKTVDVLKTYCSNTHNSRMNLNNLVNDKIKTISNLNYNDFINKLSSSKFVICPPGNGPDTHRLWETLTVGAFPILLNTPFDNLLKKQYPELPIVIVDDYFTFDYKTLEYNFPNHINILDKSYWVNRIKNEA